MPRSQNLGQKSKWCLYTAESEREAGKASAGTGIPKATGSDEGGAEEVRLAKSGAGEIGGHEVGFAEA